MPKAFALRAHSRQDVCAPSVKWRVFCAVDFPEIVRHRVSLQIARLKEVVPEENATWSRADNIHLTLKFLGDIPQTSVEQLSEAAWISCRRDAIYYSPGANRCISAIWFASCFMDWS